MAEILGIRPDPLLDLIGALGMLARDADQVEMDLVSIETLSGIDSDSHVKLRRLSELSSDLADHLRWLLIEMEAIDISGWMPSGQMFTMGSLVSPRSGLAAEDRNLDPDNYKRAGRTLDRIVAAIENGEPVDPAELDRFARQTSELSWREQYAILLLATADRSGSEAVSDTIGWLQHVHDPLEFGTTAHGELGAALELEHGESFDIATAVQATATGRTYREMELRNELDTLLLAVKADATPEQLARIAAVRAELEAIDGVDPDLGIRGDRGGFLTMAPRDPAERVLAIESVNDPDVALGAAVLGARFTDIDRGAEHLRHDEFQVVLHENGSVTITLGGLTSWSTSLDPQTSSARNFGVAAAAALPTDPHAGARRWIGAHKTRFGESLKADAYAFAVAEWVQQAVIDGVIAEGAPVLIVGHSQGAQAAVNLAQDRTFNGGLVNVTHVAAAAFANDRQACEVPAQTSLMTINNRHDLVVLAEERLEPNAFSDSCEVPPVTLQETAVAEFVGNALIHGGSAAVDAKVEHAVDGVTSLFGLDVDVPDISPALTAPSTAVRQESSILVEFSGPAHGPTGHLVSEYVDGINQVAADDGSGRAQEMLAGIAAEGFDGAGVTLAVDVSLEPRD